MEALAEASRPPGLAVGLVGDDPGSQIYLRNKVKASAELGIAGQSLTPPATITTEELLAIVDGLNRRPDIDGILVQLPLPPQVDNRRLLALEDGQVSFLERLPGQTATPKSDDRFRRRVHPAFPAALPSTGLPAHPLLRLSGQLPSRRETSPLPPAPRHALLQPVAPTRRLLRLPCCAHRRQPKALPAVRRRNSDLHPDPVALPWSGSPAHGQFMTRTRRNSRPLPRCRPGRAPHSSAQRPRQAPSAPPAGPVFLAPACLGALLRHHRLPQRQEQHTQTTRNLTSAATISGPTPKQNPLKTRPQSAV